MTYQSIRAQFPDEVEVPILPAARAAERLTSKLWSLPETSLLLEAAKNTAFISGIKLNTLDPRHYGIYLLQDCAYMASAMNNFSTIQNNANNTTELKKYYTAKAVNYKKYSYDMHRNWHINDQVDGAILLSPVARDYITFETSVVSEFHERPIYYALANYPCYRLWPEMCKYLSDSLGAESNNVYQGWIEDNKSFESANKLANLVDRYEDDFEWDSAKVVFLSALEFEVKFFDAFVELF